MPQFSDDLFLGPAQTYMGTGVVPYTATAVGGTGGASSSTLTITALTQGSPIVVGMYVDGSSVTDGTYITAFGTGSGGAGTYTLNQAINIANTTALTLHGNVIINDPSQMDLGIGPVGRIYVWDVIPQAAVTNNVAASQTAAGAGAVTLTAGTSAKSVTRPDGVTVIQLDLPRAIKVNCSTTARAFTVSGYDYYGQAMSEVITVSVAGTAVTGKKAFYQVSGATIAGSATAVVIGTSDVLGLPVRVTNVAYVGSVKSNNTLAQDAGTFVAADTATATNATGDVRGTYTPATASDGIVRTVMGILLPAIAVGPNATRVGALGVTQA
ncbi:hypothetical protein UFOVP239_71 [uncultured Caudovirales phage]|uniref:Uncharacterized protein n=1 Tax=uncultured Caudovirales phage TaxID=2100421 RepID=A0A6J7WQX0_9CAUD|nr:hypothetical protein UFOVP239_71 [uncultured Caudovirales phage]